MRSIRRHLTLSLLVAVLVAMATSGGILHARVSTALEDQFDAALSARVRALGSLLEREGKYVEFNYNDGVMPQYEPGPEAEFFTLWLSNGVEALRSASLGEAALPRRSGTVDAPVFWDLALADGRAGRAVGIDFSIAATAFDDDDDDDEGPDDDEILVDDGEAPSAGTAGADGSAAPEPFMTIVVAVSRQPLDESLAALMGGLGFAALAALGLVLWGGSMAVGRGLKPIDQLSAQVSEIKASTLSRRVESMGVPRELSPFAEKLNELLGRLELSFDKERRMTAAMAHELRTPIAELRSASDVAQRWPDDQALTDDVVSAASEVALRMSATVDAVMRYCRIEAGQDRPEIEHFGLRALIDDIWRPLATRASDRGLTLKNEIDTGVFLDTDRGLLAIVFRNLLGNAVSFADAGKVRIWSADRGLALRVYVSNATDELQPEDVDCLAEPFWRKEAARTDAEHSGLGLALVASVTEILGGFTTFNLVGGELVVEIEIPHSLTPTAAPRPSRVAVPSRRAGTG